jgi:hypothetical protein
VSVRSRGFLAALAACVLTFTSFAKAQFETRANIAIKGYPDPRSIVVGDFDGDGTPDLGVINVVQNTSGNVEILLGNGDGTFREGASYPFAAPALYGATASLRGNEILDLVIGALGASEIYVLLGNGDGTFQSAVAYPTAAESLMIGLGDFMGNGNLDVVAIGGTNDGTVCDCIEVLPGNGDGTFGTVISAPLPYGMTGYALASGDFNNDGKLDVVVAGEAFPSYELAVLLGNGNGTFSADGYYLLATAPGAIATGDFAGDKKKIDLAITSGGLAILLGNGDGTFQEATYLSYQGLPSWVIAGELSGNGEIDLAASDAGSPPSFLPGASIYNGNGNGTFQTGQFFEAGERGEGGQFVAAGDFNGDGKPDLALVNSVYGDITILLNTGVVSFSPTTPLSFGDQNIGTTSKAQTVTLTNTGTTELKIKSMKASAEFAMTSTCGSSVAAGANCTISATFSPTKEGSVQGTISIIDSASSKPQVIEVLGTGT